MDAIFELFRSGLNDSTVFIFNFPSFIIRIAENTNTEQEFKQSIRLLHKNSSILQRMHWKLIALSWGYTQAIGLNWRNFFSFFIKTKTSLFNYSLIKMYVSTWFFFLHFYFFWNGHTNQNKYLRPTNEKNKTKFNENNE